MKRAAVIVALAALACGGVTRTPESAKPSETDQTIVRGRVRMVDGTVPAEFWVSTTFTRRDAHVIGSQGEFEIVAGHATRGPHALIVRGPGFVTSRCAGPSPFEVRPGQAQDLGTIVVEKGRTLRGRVIGANGLAEIVAGRKIVWIPTSPGPIDFPLVAASGGTLASEQTAKVDAAGRFEISGLPNAPVAAVAVDSAGRISAPIVLPDGGDAEISLVIRDGGMVEGTVTRDGAQAEASMTAVTTDGFLTFVATTDDGAYRLAGLPPGDYEITAATPSDHRDARFSLSRTAAITTVTSGGTTQLDLATSSGGELTVRLAVGGGAAFRVARVMVARAPIHVTRWDALDAAVQQLDPGVPRGDLYTGARGLTWRDVPPGMYSVCAAIRHASAAAVCDIAGPSPDAPVACVEVTVAGARQELEIEVPPP